jgi:CRP-like cAMP-binding protein/RimJ/RimL family protein N-acetyltransferase
MASVPAMVAVALADFELFADAAGTDVDAWARHLVPVSVSVGEPLMRQGDDSDAFFVVLDGEALVTRRVGAAPQVVVVLRPGSIIGELGLLRQRVRAATVLVTQPVLALRGDAAAFAALLDVGGVRQRLAKLVAGRLAMFAPIVPVLLKSGEVIGVRAGLPSDRSGLAESIRKMSAESLHRRFFGSAVPEALIDYLVDIDYVDHFAWVALAAPRSGAERIGSCRYIRSVDDRSTAEVAFGLVDEWQGRGVGSVFIGALAVAAAATGITTFTASVLYDNTPMRTIFDRAGAHWAHDERGVVITAVPAAPYREALASAVRDRLEAVADEIISGAGTALL